MPMRTSRAYSPALGDFALYQLGRVDRANEEPEMWYLATPSIHVGTPYPWHTTERFLEDKFNELAVTECRQVINHPRWHNNE
jgi:hypothetical protein